MLSIGRIAAPLVLAALVVLAGGTFSVQAAGVSAPPSQPPKVKPPVPATAGDITRGLSAKDKHWQTVVSLLQRRRYQSAEKQAGKIGDPLAVKLVLWYRLTDRRTRVSFAEAAAFLDENPGWPSEGAIQETAERALAGKSGPVPSGDALLVWFAERPARTAQGAIAHVTALLRGGQKDEAIERLRRYWVELDFDRPSESQYRKAFGRFLGPEDELARLERLLIDRQQYGAKRQAARMKNGYPELVRARLALAFRRSGVDWAIKNVPHHLKDDPGLLYERARWRYRKGRYDGVVELLARTGPDQPHPELWWPIREWAARRSLDRGKALEAYSYASNHGLSEGVGFAEGEWLSGWIALRRLAKPRSAYQHFVTLYEGVGSPISLARGAYWAGEAATAMKKPDWSARWYAVAAKYSATFYGQLAAQRLGQPVARVDASHTAPSDAVKAGFFGREEARLIRLLGRIGEQNLQKKFLTRLRLTAAGGEDYHLVAELAERTGRPEIALRVAKDALRAGIQLPSQLFPSTSLPSTKGPEDSLVLAVIRQESAFNSRAISSAGARGLMQLMPATARSVARRERVRYSKTRLIQDPYYNMRLGRSYLDGLLERYKGSYVLALAAYNAGPARAKRWIRDNGDPRHPSVDPVDWIESISISETRNYVQRVLEGLTVYREQIGSPQVTWVLRAANPPS